MGKPRLWGCTPAHSHLCYVPTAAVTKGHKLGLKTTGLYSQFWKLEVKINMGRAWGAGGLLPASLLVPGL